MLDPVAGPLVGEEIEAPPVDHGTGKEADAGEGSRPQELTTIQLPNTPYVLGRIVHTTLAQRQGV
jgi:hypothetical protein